MSNRYKKVNVKLSIPQIEALAHNWLGKKHFSHQAYYNAMEVICMARLEHLKNEKRPKTR